MKKPNELYRHEQYGCLECMGCRELIEIPFEAVLKGGHGPVPIKANPENLLIWIELQELDHEKCSSFQDARQAALCREFRRPVIQ